MSKTEHSEDNVVYLKGMSNSLTDTVYFKSSRLLPLETHSNSLLRRISRICNHDDKFFIFDKSLNKVVVFDTNGKYLHHIQKVGRGPSEYESAMDFCLDSERKHLLLLCDRPYKIMEFNYSGEFIKEKNIDNLYFNIIADSEHIYCSRREMRMENRDEYLLTCMDRDFNSITEILPSRKEIAINAIFQGNNLTSTLNGYYTRAFDNSIYLLDNEKLIKKYSIDFGKHAFQLDLLKKEESYSNIAEEKKYVSSISEVSESENYLMFNTNIGIFVLDKKQNTVEGYKIILNSTIEMGGNGFYSIGNNPKMIASRIEPSVLLNVIKERKNHPDFDNFALLKLAQEVREDDNPILVLYEVK
jgi:hypothetical protein